jgi:Holliday junction resolvase YEN1
MSLQSTTSRKLRCTLSETVGTPVDLFSTMLTRSASDQPAFQGIEKAMFYRICRFLTLNIQLVFVFDGPSRPWKRGGRGGGRIDYRERDLLKEVLRHFGIPYHEAPGEAEAECARMQILGLVDAVWSQDSDCLMFGCTLWIRDDRVAKANGGQDRSKENTEKSKKTARVVRAQDLKDRLAIDCESLVPFAMLVGGDYDTKGLPSCGPKVAMRAVAQGLGRSLCLCRSQRDCDTWSMQLADFLRTTSRGQSIDVPLNSPDFKTLQKYYNPKVSADEVLRNNARLNLDFVRPIQELKLLEITGSRFNMWGRLYMNWVGPVLLTRYLSTRNVSSPREMVHDIRFTKRRANKSDTELPTRVLERKLTFSPFGVTSLTKEDFVGERAGYWDRDRDIPFDPEYRVEPCEIPEYWLRKVLPPDVLNPPPHIPKPQASKRKQSTDTNEQAESPSTTKRKRTSIKHADPPAPHEDSRSVASGSSKHRTNDQRSAKPPKTSCKPASAERANDVITLSDSEDDMELHIPPLRSRLTSSAKSTLPQIIDFGSPSASDSDEEPSSTQEYTKTPSLLPSYQAASSASLVDDDEKDVQLALELSMQEQIDAPLSTRRTHDASNTSTRDCARSVTDCSALVAKQAFDPRPNLVAVSTSEQIQSPAAIQNRIFDLTTPAHLPEWSSFKSPGMASKYVHPKTSMAGLVTGSNKRASTESSAKSTADVVRAARLRHFAPPANTSNLANVQQTLATSFQVPVGAQCMNLTDD